MSPLRGEVCMRGKNGSQLFETLFKRIQWKTLNSYIRVRECSGARNSAFSIVGMIELVKSSCVINVEMKSFNVV